MGALFGREREKEGVNELKEVDREAEKKYFIILQLIKENPARLLRFELSGISG